MHVLHVLELLQVKQPNKQIVQVGGDKNVPVGQFE
jgi:hypothetical protein